MVRAPSRTNDQSWKSYDDALAEGAKWQAAAEYRAIDPLVGGISMAAQRMQDRRPSQVQNNQNNTTAIVVVPQSTAATAVAPPPVQHTPVTTVDDEPRSYVVGTTPLVPVNLMLPVEEEKPGCCCAVVNVRAVIKGGQNETRIAVLISLKWVLAPAGVRAPCEMEWFEKSDMDYPIPGGFPGGKLPGDEKWHRLFPPPPGSVPPYPNNYPPFAQWNTCVSEMNSKPCPTPEGVSLGCELDDQAPWDPKVAKKTYGKSTRYLEGYVRVRSGCAGSNKKTMAVSWHTDCGSDGKTTPPEPKSIPGVVE